MAVIWQLLDSSGPGGIETHVTTLTRALMAAGRPTRVMLLSHYTENPWRDKLDHDHVPYQELTGKVLDLISHLREAQPDLIHTHGYKANICGRIAARLLGIPVVSSYHAGERAPFPVSLYQKLDMWTSFFARRIAAVSTHIAHTMPFPTPVIPNFIDAPSGPSSQLLPRSIAFIGRLSHEKAPDRFCEIAARYPDIAKWHIYGDGPMRRDLEARYAGIVQFHGYVPDIETVLATTGLLVMPSRAEGLPMAALEAMADGIPVLATPVGALPELINSPELGAIFDPSDHAAVGSYLGRWAVLTPWRQIETRTACWRRIIQSYSAAARLPDILSIYAAAGLRN